MHQFSNAEFQQNYGMTECFPMTSLLAEYHTKDGDDKNDELRMMTAGQPRVPQGAKFLDNKDDKTKTSGVFLEDEKREGEGLVLETGEVGQICAKCAKTMIGYYNDPNKTKHTKFPDGFVRTGDLGKIVEVDGIKFLQIVGRIKDLIVSHTASNIVPSDLENVFQGFEKGKRIAELSVVGVTHYKSGEGVVVWVKAVKEEPKITAQELKTYGASKLSVHQIPDAIYVTYEDLPKAGAGAKFSKKDMRSLDKDGFLAEHLRAVLQTKIEESEKPDQKEKEAVTRTDSENQAAMLVLKQLKLENKSPDSFWKALKLMEAFDKASFILGVRSLVGAKACGMGSVCEAAFSGP